MTTTKNNVSSSMTDEEIRNLRARFVGERVKWSRKYGGCLMWCRGADDWASQGEGDYPTPAEATSALAFYDAQGAIVDWATHDASIAAGERGFVRCGYLGCELEHGHKTACKITLWGTR